MCAEIRLRVKAGRFEGPLDLMYTLARREELGLSAMEVAPLAERVRHEARSCRQEPGVVARWARLVAGVAAAKAHALVPGAGEPLVLEEEAPARDRRLVAWTRALLALDVAAGATVTRRGEGGRPARPERVSDLVAARRRIKGRDAPVRPFTPPVPRADLSSRIAELEAFIAQGPVLLFDDADPPAQRVRSLLAGLLMVHGNRAILVQETPFGPILVERAPAR